jgi:hypothetical protein
MNKKPIEVTIEYRSDSIVVKEGDHTLGFVDFTKNNIYLANYPENIQKQVEKILKEEWANYLIKQERN